MQSIVISSDNRATSALLSQAKKEDEFIYDFQIEAPLVGIFAPFAVKMRFNRAANPLRDRHRVLQSLGFVSFALETGPKLLQKIPHQTQRIGKEGKTVRDRAGGTPPGFRRTRRESGSIRGKGSGRYPQSLSVPSGFGPDGAGLQVQWTPLNRATSGLTLYVSNMRLELLSGGLI